MHGLRPRKGRRATPTPACELCASPLVQGRCPACGEARALYLGLRPGVFPATALPPSGLTREPGLADLRRALSLRHLERADALWSGLLRTLKPLGDSGRGQVADCLEAQARLKEALGRPTDAQALLQRARTLRGAGGKPERSGGRSAARASDSGWDNHAWVRLQSGGDGPSPEVLDRVRAELEREEVRGRRWKVYLTLGTGGLAGLWCSAFTGLSAGLLVSLGLCFAWLWVRLRLV